MLILHLVNQSTWGRHTHELCNEIRRKKCNQSPSNVSINKTNETERKPRWKAHLKPDKKTQQRSRFYLLLVVRTGEKTTPKTTFLRQHIFHRRAHLFLEVSERALCQLYQRIHWNKMGIGSSRCMYFLFFNVHVQRHTIYNIYAVCFTNFTNIFRSFRLFLGLSVYNNSSWLRWMWLAELRYWVCAA